MIECICPLYHPETKKFKNSQMFLISRPNKKGTQKAKRAEEFTKVQHDPNSSTRKPKVEIPSEK